MNKDQELIIQENINKIASQITNISQQISIIQTQLHCSDNSNFSLTNELDELDEYVSYLCLTAKHD